MQSDSIGAVRGPSANQPQPKKLQSPEQKERALQEQDAKNPVIAHDKALERLDKPQRGNALDNEARRVDTKA